MWGDEAGPIPTGVQPCATHSWVDPSTWGTLRARGWQAGLSLHEELDSPSILTTFSQGLGARPDVELDLRPDCGQGLGPGL